MTIEARFTHFAGNVQDVPNPSTQAIVSSVLGSAMGVDVVLVAPLQHSRGKSVDPSQALCVATAMDWGSSRGLC